MTFYRCSPEINGLVTITRCKVFGSDKLIGHKLGTISRPIPNNKKEKENEKKA